LLSGFRPVSADDSRYADWHHRYGSWINRPTLDKPITLHRKKANILVSGDTLIQAKY
jgi:hypothetical protein